jgi:alkanesulfonate monooxygenase SsuD/methylene tetrahydromethanopterin reductase-like flavin-dependent oxidoreductase (luciferase family)
MTIFGTVHAPLLHPVIAAKEFVTADQIGEGRFGLNVVCGWNEDEFEMFGVERRDHESAYDYAQEWLDAIKMMWTRDHAFDFDGKFIKLKDVQAEPKPYGSTRPLIMNAGLSPTGQAFAIRNCDALFLGTSRGSLGKAAETVARAKALAREEGRDLKVYTVGVVCCRASRSEAEDYYHRCVLDNADWPAIDQILAMRKVTRDLHAPDEFERIRKVQANGLGGMPLIGDPDEVASELINLSAVGLDGIAISFVNYADELPFFCSEILPRLQRAQLRETRPR